MPYLPDGPGYVAGSETSKAAAKAIKPKVPTYVERIIQLLTDTGPPGLTSEETEEWFERTYGRYSGKHQTISARYSELKEAGLLVWDGKTKRRNQSGVLAECLYPVDDALDLYRKLKPYFDMKALLKRIQTTIEQAQRMPTLVRRANAAIGVNQGEGIGQEMMELGDKLYKIGIDVGNEV